MRHNAGFTLIETMISVSVLGILAGVAAPSFLELIEHQHASAAMSSLTTHMAQARMAAITYRRPAVLCPSTTGTSCDAGSDWSGGWMLFLDQDGNHQFDVTDEILRADLTPTSRHLRLPGTAGRPQLRYLPDGRSAGSNLTISVCNTKGDLLGKVIVNNGGRPRTETPKAATPCPA
ncbi:GspH/FimT family pseudopilin [Thermomonas sp.]|uniref:GspH/FimT family pseudopilin n=1 Tax=Thermomonas sp. TaxID=1971895 RepID=UPI00248A0A92|nr:GspH/FimT family pseudopilin [Thermomonas sp.]MDI1252040.1 GspH/FimT family pseudopilin [Thermomonas sp.]